MESFHSSSLLLPLLVLSFSLPFASCDYELPQQYFVNCGSSSTAFIYGLRTFIGDQGSKVDGLSVHGGSSVENLTSSTLEIYQTARIFRRRSSYEFKIVENGTYAVRFHFYPFPAIGNMSAARFSVEVSTNRVLSNFSVDGLNSPPIIEEFFLTGRDASPGKIRIRFVPDGDTSFAFVNAIELFLAPPDFFGNTTSLLPTERPQADADISSLALRVIHRINVGGENVTPNSDTLLRNWISDDDYLLPNGSATKSGPYTGSIKYGSIGATSFIAPPPVYSTARELKAADTSAVFNSTASWAFDVKKRARHFIRLHFCDVVSVSQNQLLKFDLSIYSMDITTIRQYDVLGNGETATPFYYDYVVESDQSGFLNISIGLNNDSSPYSAFLNGVEIMQLVNDKVPEDSGWSKQRVLLVVGLCVGGLVLVLLLLAGLLLFFLLRKRKRDSAKPTEAFDRPLTPMYVGSTHSRSTDKTISGADLNLGLKVNLTDILFATNNFDPKYMIGRGGFGKVYKATWRNGTMVAIKRSEQGHGQGLPEFQTEILVLSKIRHRHLVSLIGYCNEGNEMILIYEFMEKGTLRDHLYAMDGDQTNGKGSQSTSELSWEQRLGICIGAAKGLHYLHTGSGKTIIHRDIKSTNILLDEDYVAKVADFGLSRLGPRDETHVSTTDVKGSFGYLDPECFIYLQLTLKSDVYAFGVVLLEILCARPAVNISLPRNEVNLAEWGMSCLRKGQLEAIVDPMLVGKISPNSLRKFGETVEKCLKERGVDRPSMVDVVWDLEYCLKLQQTSRPVMESCMDSTTDMSLDFEMRHAVQRMPSHSLVEDEDEDEDAEYEPFNKVDSCEVFSQLRKGDGR